MHQTGGLFSPPTGLEVPVKCSTLASTHRHHVRWPVTDKGRAREHFREDQTRDQKAGRGFYANLSSQEPRKSILPGVALPETLAPDSIS